MDEFFNELIQKYTNVKDPHLYNTVDKLWILCKIRQQFIDSSLSLTYENMHITLFCYVLCDKFLKVHNDILAYDQTQNLFKFDLPRNFTFNKLDLVDIYYECLSGINLDNNQYDLLDASFDEKQEILSLISKNDLFFNQGKQFVNYIKEITHDIKIWVTPVEYDDNGNEMEVENKDINFTPFGVFPLSLAETIIGKKLEAQIFTNFEYIALVKMQLDSQYLKMTNMKDLTVMMEKFAKDQKAQQDEIEKAQRKNKSR